MEIVLVEIKGERKRNASLCKKAHYLGDISIIDILLKEKKIENNLKCDYEIKYPKLSIYSIYV